MGKVIEFPTPPDSEETPQVRGVDYFIAPDIMAEARVTFRQVDYWTRTGLLVPINNNPTSGHHRHYAPEQLARAKAISALLWAGLALPSIRKNLDTLLDVGALTYGPVTITYTTEEDPA